jgi:Galactose oxidase, central domain
VLPSSTYPKCPTPTPNLKYPPTPNPPLYDPISKLWSPAGSMIHPRINHVAVQIPDGRVLIIGGDNNILETELYDPDTNSWRLTKGKLNITRAGSTAVLLQDGKGVLVIGGTRDEDIYAAPTDELGTNTAEIFDIATERWKLVKSMQLSDRGSFQRSNT